PGSSGWPFFSIVADVVDDQGISVGPNEQGRLVIKQPWPGMMATIYGDKQRFVQTYLEELPGAYLTGDLAYYDEKGDFWILGREDDVIKVSGHRLGTEELESALVSHPLVSEAGVVGFPHPIKGEGLYAFVTLQSDAKPTDALKKILIEHVREKIGPVATLDVIQWADGLPKTRSGKIMRRILRGMVRKLGREDLGDLSTLADPGVIDNLIQGVLVLL
ncbi:MAG: AMP-binding enzyme, partial [Legionellaceae bacterium]